MPLQLVAKLWQAFRWISQPSTWCCSWRGLSHLLLGSLVFFACLHLLLLPTTQVLNSSFESHKAYFRSAAWDQYSPHSSDWWAAEPVGKDPAGAFK